MYVCIYICIHTHRYTLFFCPNNPRVTFKWQWWTSPETALAFSLEVRIGSKLWSLSVTSQTFIWSGSIARIWSGAGYWWSLHSCSGGFFVCLRQRNTQKLVKWLVCQEFCEDVFLWLVVQRRQTQRVVMVVVRGKYMHFACSSYKDGPIYLDTYIYMHSYLHAKPCIRCFSHMTDILGIIQLLKLK